MQQSCLAGFLLGSFHTCVGTMGLMVEEFIYTLKSGKIPFLDGRVRTAVLSSYWLAGLFACLFYLVSLTAVNYKDSNSENTLTLGSLCLPGYSVEHWKRLLWEL